MRVWLGWGTQLGENKGDCINLTQVAHFQRNVFMRNCIRPK